jgi:hypothetical protein
MGEALLPRHIDYRVSSERDLNGIEVAKTRRNMIAIFRPAVRLPFAKI